MNEQDTQNNPSNTRQYFLIAFILLLLGMGISMIYKSFAPAKQVVAENTVDPTIGIIDENDAQPEDQTLNDIIDKQDVDFEDNKKEDFSTKGIDHSQSETVVDVNPTTTRNPKRTKNTQDTETTILADESDHPKKLTKYMVITGSFGSIENARKRLEQTIAAGYRDAEIVNFDNSKYHTVCAIRTDHESTARAAVKKLKSKKIDAILHTQRRGK